VHGRTLKEHNTEIIINASFQRTLNAVYRNLSTGRSVGQRSEPMLQSPSHAFGNVSYFNICIYCHSEHSV
jgi:hypothetical protein